MRKKQKGKHGDVIQIDLGNGHCGFGQVLNPPLIAFFNLRTTESPTLEQILLSDVAFSVWVMDYAITDGDWPVIGKAPVSNAINESRQFFKQDAISGALSITYTGAEEEPATLDSVEGLECAAVWEPQQVVDRLNDHFAGHPNKWVNSMKPV